YTALSYVWGKRSPGYRTTKANLSFYKVRIDPAILPQTILDAIHVTRALGISLLWIDGLCIVQDSTKDMHHELARMRDVYRHAFLTIDAGSAASVSEGFLQDRQPLHKPDAFLPFICPPGAEEADRSTQDAQVGMVYLVSNSPEYCTISDTQKPIAREYTSHTVRRGWCLQERLLSTRSLIFTTETLQLRCHTHTQNVGGAHHDGRGDLPLLPDAIFHPDSYVAHESDEWEDTHGRWKEIVEDYSGRELSNSSDKLTAISGLAEMFSPILRSSYVAGLWCHDTLLHDLLWRPRYPPRPRTSGYCGPSWSWASSNGEVLWHDEPDISSVIAKPWNGGPLAEVVECTVDLENQNLPFGPVAGGSLILR
ncbi:heterokaryon incompatibility protein-domain-containing protein, partial [Cubamyces menziesii]